MTTPAKRSYRIDPRIVENAKTAYASTCDELGIAWGTCFCLCGEATPLATKTISTKGLFLDLPHRYIKGHENRKSPVAYAEKDCGYITPCYVWLRGGTADGYGIRTRDGKLQTAHRLAYIDAYGPIPDDWVVHHKCENPPCVRPDHLQAMSNADNIRLSSRTTLTREIVVEILERRKAGERWKALAEHFGISYCGIRAIGCGMRWGDVRQEWLASTGRESRSEDR